MHVLVTEGASETRARHEMPVLTSLGLRAAAAGRLHSGLAGGLTPESAALRSAKWVPLLRLDLNSSAVFSGGAGNDHQVATGIFRPRPAPLGGLAHGVDDRGTCGVCHEALQTAQGAPAPDGSFANAAHNGFLPGSSPLTAASRTCQPSLVEECYASSGLFPPRPQSCPVPARPAQLRCLPGYASGLAAPLWPTPVGALPSITVIALFAGLFGGKLLAARRRRPAGAWPIGLVAITLLVRVSGTDACRRRFHPPLSLAHVLPEGFHRIRHYGPFATAGAVENIARARQLLQPAGAAE